MDLDGIEVFVEVVGAGSFVKAAERLRMPPATVSAKIARMEQRLGVTLIQRTTRRLNVTPAGEAYYAHCARAVAEMQEAQLRLKESLAEPQGQLRLTAPVDLSHTVLPPLVERFLELYPKVSIDLVITNRRVDLLAEGIDIAIRAGVLADSSLISRTLFIARLSLWASQDYIDRHGMPKTPNDLAKHSFVAFSSQAAMQARLRAGRRSLAMPSKSRIVCDDLESVRIYVARGNGIGLLPDVAGTQASLVPVLPEFKSASGAVSLVYPAQKFVAPAVRAFIGVAADKKLAPWPNRSERCERSRRSGQD